MHSALLEASGANGSPRDQRIGRVLLNHGSNIKAAHMTYWANHPKAVCVLEKYREELDAFMDSKYNQTQLTVIFPLVICLIELLWQCTHLDVSIFLSLFPLSQ